MTPTADPLSFTPSFTPGLTGGMPVSNADGEPTELFCRPDGRIEAVYTDLIDLGQLGTIAIRRASHVEPDDAGHWWADLQPCGGGRLGPFTYRSAALAAERLWLSDRLAAPR